MALNLPVIGYAKSLGEFDRKFLDAPNVTVRHLVLGVDGHRQRLDRRQIQLIDFSQVLIGVVKAPERCPNRDK